jgi:hypothetical protein
MFIERVARVTHPVGAPCCARANRPRVEPAHCTPLGYGFHSGHGSINIGRLLGPANFNA